MLHDTQELVCCYYMYTYKNNSVLPPILYKTNTSISSFRVSNKYILSVINSLDSSKSHGYDNVSVRMAKICSESVTMPLKIIFEELLIKRNIKNISRNSEKS